MNFKEEFLKIEEDFLKDLKGLIKIDSSIDVYNPNNKEFPFGKGPRQALDYVEQLCIRDNFLYKVYDNMVLEISYGQQDEFILAAGHLDVVPAGDKMQWKTDPFEMIYDELTDKLIGRGTLDDKGAALASYYALKIIKENNIPLSKKIKLIFGTDEESGSRCVKRYNELVKEKPVCGFIPDADFPLIFSEKGILRVDIVVDDSIIEDAFGGNTYNMVSQDCFITLKEETNSIKTISQKGISAHGSTPENGISAILKCALHLKKQNIQTNLINILNDLFIFKNDKFDTEGKLLKINTKNKLMGNLTINIGVLKKISNDKFLIGLDIRYPKNINANKILSKINKKLSSFAVASIRSNTKHLFVSPKSNLIKTLHKVYKEYTNDDKTKLIATGGGTYAREFENMVAFGPQFPGKESLMHAPNEYIYKKDLLDAGAIYLQAFIELAK